MSDVVKQLIDTSGNQQCSFCGKHHSEVQHLIAGPTQYICDECVQLCVDIIAEVKRQPSSTTV